MRTKSRGNGQGTAYKRGNTWEAQVVVGWKKSKDGSSLVPVKRRKGGFPSKKDAINYCATLRLDGNARRRMTLEQCYESWSSFYSSRVGSSTMTNYHAAYNYFSTLHGISMDLISSDDLQQCIDDCPRGHRTHVVMKCIAGLLWGYAFDNNIVEKDITSNLFIGRGHSVQRDPITAQEVAAIRSSIGKVRYAEYIYCLCYLGFRPGEFLELRKDMLHCTVLPADDKHPEDRPVWYFINGKKTPAGKDRIVIIPNQILEIVLSRVFVPGTDLMFPKYKTTRNNIFLGFVEMPHAYLNREVFKPLMSSLGFSPDKSPYCARHTYSDKLKYAPGSDRDKAALIGHSQYLFTQKRYQSTAIADLKDIVDSFD